MVTPFTSLLMRPAGAARTGRCGERSAKTRGPGQAREFRDREEAEERRARTVGGEERPLDSGWASSSSSRGAGGGDCSSLALLSPQPQLQPKTKTLSTCQQRRSSLGRAARASEQRGEGKEERAAARDHPSPTLGAAEDGRPGSGRSAAAAQPPLASQAGEPTANWRGREVSMCLCVFVYGRGCGAGASARVLADPGERGKQDNCTQHRSPLFPSREHGARINPPST